MRKLLKVHQDGQTTPDKSNEDSLPDSPQASKRRRLTTKTTCTVTKPKQKQSAGQIVLYTPLLLTRMPLEH